jgi:hypothetical protein
MKIGDGAFKALSVYSVSGEMPLMLMSSDYSDYKIMDIDGTVKKTLLSSVTMKRK